MPVPAGWDVEKAVASCPPVGVRGELWRFHLAGREPLDYSGYLYGSGRFHRGAREHGVDNAWPALYLSSGPHIAVGEYLRHRVDLSELRETALTRVGVSISVVLDCRDLSALGLTWKQLLDDTDYDTGQALAAEVLKQGYEGLIAPTATRFDGWNLAYFPAPHRPASKLEVLGTENPQLYLGSK